MDKTCKHFKLNVIAFERGKKSNDRKPRKKAHKSKRTKTRAHSANKKDQIKIRSEPFTQGAIELDVQTVCNYDGIIIKVRTVILGQNVDLRIDDDDNFGSNYTVTTCIARDRNDRESLTIIED
ncbi:hypothetical protein OSTOST_17683, partial [Ostertagia ostertagi]